MQRIPDKIDYLASFLPGLIAIPTKGNTIRSYICNEDISSKKPIYVKFEIPEKEEDRVDKYKIVEEENEYVNGFKLVKNAYSQYLYKREEDNELLPYIFDVATNFNEDGLAMVGINNQVTWIDKNFNYFNMCGETVKLPETDVDNKFRGHLTVEKFSNGKNPVSKCYGADSIYMKKDLSCMVFREWNGMGETGFTGKTEYKFTGVMPSFNDKKYLIANKDSATFFKIISADFECYITGETIVNELIRHDLLFDYCFEKVIKDGLIDQLLAMAEVDKKDENADIWDKNMVPLPFGPEKEIPAISAPICVIDEPVKVMQKTNTDKK